mgnify:FL=1
MNTHQAKTCLPQSTRLMAQTFFAANQCWEPHHKFDSATLYTPMAFTCFQNHSLKSIYETQKFGKESPFGHARYTILFSSFYRATCASQHFPAHTPRVLHGPAGILHGQVIHWICTILNHVKRDPTWHLLRDFASNLTRNRVKLAGS